jgi:uncharacterized phiE125 gp8 family phage protein
MPHRRLTEPAVEPLTLAEVKAHLEVVASTHDTMIAALITAARQKAEGRCNRTLITSSHLKTEDCFPDAIRLPMGRVLGITEVRYRDTDGTELVLAPVGYTLDNAGGSRDGWLFPASGYDWPATWDQPSGVTVEYTAGYGPAASDVPQLIKQWMLLTIGAWFKNPEGVITGTIVATLPDQFFDSLLDQFVIQRL